jgi:hypothetical protein
MVERGDEIQEEGSGREDGGADGARGPSAFRSFDHEDGRRRDGGQSAGAVADAVRDLLAERLHASSRRCQGTSH